MDLLVSIVVFRADASLQIGTGHVMRCLTLADALKAKGAECRFICRQHEGNLIEHIRVKGYIAHALPVVPSAGISELATERLVMATESGHAHWLGATQAQDAAACALILAELNPDWLVVDHYALDAFWESAVKPHCRHLLVIDDLADRAHQCSVLLDQTFGRSENDYQGLVPAGCRTMCGSNYALLRPEFAALRDYSLKRRINPQLRRLLVTMGGVDHYNATGRVLEALKGSPLPADCKITVVMGSTAPWLAVVMDQAQSMPWPTEVLVGVGDMAGLMAESDLAIGAAGATSWERCCLGLPTIMVVLAENQQLVAQGLARVGAAKVLEDAQCIGERLPELLQPMIECPATLLTMTQCASDIVDGYGVDAVTQLLEPLT